MKIIIVATSLLLLIASIILFFIIQAVAIEEYKSINNAKKRRDKLKKERDLYNPVDAFNKCNIHHPTIDNLSTPPTNSHKNKIK